MKVTLLGDTGCGKTSIVKRLVHKDPNTCSFAAIGASFTNYSIKINSLNVKVFIWDPSGHEKYMKLCRTYYKNANVVILVCDASRPDQKKSLKKWYSNVIEEVPKKKALFFIVINKIDLKSGNSQIPNIEKFASKIKAEIFETSAKQGLGVTELFNKIAESYISFRSIISIDSFFLESRSHSILLKKSNMFCCKC